MIPLAILAGGRATRLGSLAAGGPKSLVPAGGAPFLDHQLAWASRQGVRRVVLCVGYRSAAIRRHIGSGRRRGLAIRCSDEGPRPIGTAAALRRALPLLGPRFFVLYGDSYLPVPYAAVEGAQRAAGLPALMVIHRNAGRWARSNVAPRGGRVARYVPGGGAGLRWIDAGLAVLTRAALAISRDADLPAVYERLAAAGLLACWRSRLRFYEVGSPRGLGEFRRRAAALRVAARW